MDLLLLLAGLAILLGAGDLLVRGAVNLSLRLGIPALVVSLTVVAFGTSAPELLISVQSILAGAPDLALGNVVGSNTANVLLVLGLPALLAGIATSRLQARGSYLQMMAATALFVALCFAGPLVWWHGLVLLAGLAVMLALAFRKARAHRRDGEDEPEGADPAMPGWRIAVSLALGLVGLPIGADLLIDAATRLAASWGIGEAAIGLTLVAVGTSLPELATSISAAYRRQGEVAMGNVLGSNMFNLLAIIGIAALVGPIPVGAQFLRFDLWVMAGAALLLAPFVLGWNLSRLWGGALTALYVGYAALVLA